MERVYHSRPYSLETGSLIDLLLVHLFVYSFIHSLSPAPHWVTGISRTLVFYADTGTRTHARTSVLTHCPVSATDTQNHK